MPDPLEIRRDELDIAWNLAEERGDMVAGILEHMLKLIQLLVSAPFEGDGSVPRRPPQHMYRLGIEPTVTRHVRRFSRPLGEGFSPVGNDVRVGSESRQCFGRGKDGIHARWEKQHVFCAHPLDLGALRSNKMRNISSYL